MFKKKKSHLNFIKSSELELERKKFKIIQTNFNGVAYVDWSKKELFLNDALSQPIKQYLLIYFLLVIQNNKQKKKILHYNPSKSTNFDIQSLFILKKYSFPFKKLFENEIFSVLSDLYTTSIKRSTV